MRTLLAIAMMLACVIAASVGAQTALAQEGHPLTGTWSGDWGTNAADRHHLTVVMIWDGTTIAGTVNPGPNQTPLAAASLDPSTWTVRFEADVKGDGTTTHLVAEGRIEDLGSYHRRIVGTWSQGSAARSAIQSPARTSATGDFRLTRD